MDHKRLSVLQVLIFLAMFEIGKAVCPGVSTQQHGYVYYKSRKSYETCSWTFDKNESDVIFSMKIISNSDFDSKDVISLPDGTSLRSLDERDVDSTDTPWCGVFVKPNNGNETTCRNVTYPQLCDQSSTYSQEWPPVIGSYIGYESVLVTYAFIKCEEIDKVVPPETSTAYQTTATAYNEQQADTTTTDPALIMAIILSNLLILTASILLATVVKYRNATRHNKSNNQRAAHDVDNGYSTTQEVVGSVNTSAEPYSIAEPIQPEYGNISSERVMADNVLYTAADESEKNNDLYAVVKK